MLHQNIYQANIKLCKQWQRGKENETERQTEKYV